MIKVYLYSELQDLIEKSGVGRAYKHLQFAIDSNPNLSLVEKKEDADLIHINTIFANSLILAKWARYNDIPLVYHAHSTREDFRESFIGSNQFSGVFYKWIKSCYKVGDVIITPTPYSKKLLESYGLTQPIFPLTNGVDLSYYVKKEEDDEIFRREYGYEKEDKIIMSSGLWINRKGILDFIDLARRMPQYKFIWFGQSDLKTVPREISEEMAKKPENLLFPGYVAREDLRRAYSACDLFLFPSYEETEGIVVLEALAMKIPVLVRDIPVYKGWLYDDENSYMANSNEEFEEKARGILEGSLRDLTEEGYRVVEDRDLKDNGKKLELIYKYCINQKKTEEMEKVI